LLTKIGAVFTIKLAATTFFPCISICKNMIPGYVFSDLPAGRVAFSIALLSAFYPVGAVDFEKEIRPILSEKCYQCHSGPKSKGKLRMDSQASFAGRIGGDDPVIVPGDAANSLLAIKAGLPRSDGEAMPPPPARAKGAKEMTPSELTLVKQWITEGAKFEAGAAPAAPAPATPTTETPSVPATTTAPAAMANEVRSWTSQAGTSLEAIFVSLAGEVVTLKKPDGSATLNVPISQLDAASQAMAKQLAGQ
jgi:Planctomycete cytochrome C